MTIGVPLPYPTLHPLITTSFWGTPSTLSLYMGPPNSNISTVSYIKSILTLICVVSLFYKKKSSPQHYFKCHCQLSNKLKESCLNHLTVTIFLVQMFLDQINFLSQISKLLRSETTQAHTFKLHINIS